MRSFMLSAGLVLVPAAAVVDILEISHPWREELAWWLVVVVPLLEKPWPEKAVNDLAWYPCSADRFVVLL
jgi:hypothetical protein